MQRQKNASGPYPPSGWRRPSPPGRPRPRRPRTRRGSQVLGLGPGEGSGRPRPGSRRCGDRPPGRPASAQTAGGHRESFLLNLYRPTADRSYRRASKKRPLIRVSAESRVGGALRDGACGKSPAGTPPGFCRCPSPECSPAEAPPQRVPGFPRRSGDPQPGSGR